MSSFSFALFMCFMLFNTMQAAAETGDNKLVQRQRRLLSSSEPASIDTEIEETDIEETDLEETDLEETDLDIEETDIEEPDVEEPDTDVADALENALDGLPDSLKELLAALFGVSLSSADSVDSADSSSDIYYEAYDEPETTLPGGLPGPGFSSTMDIDMSSTVDDVASPLIPTTTTLPVILDPTAECACSAFSEECPDCKFVDRCGDGADCQLTIDGDVTALLCNIGLATQQTFSVVGDTGTCLEMGENDNQSSGMDASQTAACANDLTALATELGCSVTVV